MANIGYYRDNEFGRIFCASSGILFELKTQSQTQRLGILPSHLPPSSTTSRHLVCHIAPICSALYRCGEGITRLTSSAFSFLYDFILPGRITHPLHPISPHFSSLTSPPSPQHAPQSLHRTSSTQYGAISRPQAERQTRPYQLLIACSSPDSGYPRTRMGVHRRLRLSLC